MSDNSGTTGKTGSEIVLGMLREGLEATYAPLMGPAVSDPETRQFGNLDRRGRTLTHPHRLDPGHRDALLAEMDAKVKMLKTPAVYDKTVDDGITDTGWKIFKDHNDAEYHLMKGKLLIMDRRIEELESSLQARTDCVRIQAAYIDAAEGELARLRIELEKATKAAAAVKPADEPAIDWYQPSPLPRGMR